MSKFICMICKKDNNRVQFGEFRCKECSKMHCQDHSAISVFSTNERGDLVNDFSVCTECGDRDRQVKMPMKKSTAPSWVSAKRGKPRRVVGKLPEYKPYVAPAPSPQRVFFKAIPKAAEPLRIDVSPECYIDMMLMRTQDSSEIAGFGVVNGEGELVWTAAAELDTNSGAHVKSNSAEATIAGILSGYGVPNLQWHTHPGLSAYFSVTDETDQAQFIMDAMEISKSGEYVFLCFDTIDWVVSRVRWDDGVATEIAHGHCYLKGVKMAKPRQAFTPAKPYTTRVIGNAPLMQPTLPRSFGPSASEGLWEPYGDWMDESFGLETVMRKDTGEIAPLSGMAKYYKHFGVSEGDWESLVACAEAIYGEDWDWDLSKVANGGSL